MEKYLIHSNELHFINKERIHREVEKMVESLDMAAGSTKGFDLYTVVESYFTDLEKRREINRLLHIEKESLPVEVNSRKQHPSKTRKN